MGILLVQMGQPADALSCFWRAAIFFRRGSLDVQAARSCNKILEINSNHEGALEMLNSLFPGKFTKTLLDQRKNKIDNQVEQSIGIPIANEDLILADTREIPMPLGVDSIKVKVAAPPTGAATSDAPPVKKLHPGIMKPLSLRDIPSGTKAASKSKVAKAAPPTQKVRPKKKKAAKPRPPFLANATEAPVKTRASRKEAKADKKMPPPNAVSAEKTKQKTPLVKNDLSARTPVLKKDTRQRKLAITQPVPPGLIARSTKRAGDAKKIKIEAFTTAERATLDTTEQSAPPRMDPDPLAKTTPISIGDFAPSILPSYFLDQGSVRHFVKNEYIFREKETSEELYLIEHGTVEVTKKARGMRRRKLATLKEGECFGELALLGDGIRHTTAKATVSGTLRVFERSKIKALMAQNADFNRALRAVYRHRLQTFLLKISSIFSGLPKKEAITFIRRCKPLGLKAGQIVVEEGSPATGFYIVLLGQLEVSVRPKKGGPTKVLGKLTDGEFFGEISLVYDQPTTATIRTSGFSQLLQMSAGEFHRFVNSNHAFMKIIETEARRREKSNRAILRGTAKYDEKKGVVFLKED